MDLLKPNIDALQEWIDTGKSDILSDKMVVYLEQLELIRSMYSKHQSQRFIIKTILKLYPDISQKHAYDLFTDSMNFFYQNSGITKEAWRNIYADKFENAAQVCWELTDMEGFRKNLESAMKARGLDIPDPEKFPEDFYDRRIVIYQMDPEKVGIKRESRSKIAELIDKMDLTDNEKDKVYQDAGIINVEFLEEHYAEDNS